MDGNGNREGEDEGMKLFNCCKKGLGPLFIM